MSRTRITLRPLGFAADERETAAILEESVQNTYPETVTIRLRDWEVREAKKRTAETGCTLKYTLLSARTPGELMTGGGAVVTNESECAVWILQVAEIDLRGPAKRSRW